jgi:L-histidine N-alpha-methyltransferase
MMEPMLAPEIVVDCVLAEGHERVLADDVLDGLTRPLKELPPKHFYDARGSELFDAICALPEYYPTRTERAILFECAAEIVASTAAVELVELGSGSAEKTRVLLDAMAAAGTLERYVPVDVSETALRTSAAGLIAEYPGLRVHGLVGDFERHLDKLPAAAGPRVMCFLGGTIGNFPPGSRRRFLRGLAKAAYDDAAGVTAEFNRNVLHVVNRELDADFDPGAFDHVAFFDAEREWIEMRLRARTRQVVTIRALGLVVRFAAREELRTEISAKFTRERLEGDLAAAGLELTGWHTDVEERFAVTLSRPVPSAA